MLLIHCCKFRQNMYNNKVVNPLLRRSRHGEFVKKRSLFDRFSLSDDKLLQIWSICPYGGMGPMMRHFLLGEEAQHPLQFRNTHPNATRMYQLSRTSPAPIGVLRLATANWNSSQTTDRKFYGHSYTAPTPTVHFLQQFGLACTKAFAIHLQRKPTRPPRSRATPARNSPSRNPPGLTSHYLNNSWTAAV